MQVTKHEKWNGTGRFILVFFLSGAAGLAYQMVWAKAFVASIGSEYPAVLAVVTAFMAGMAIGNLLLVRRHPISPKLYGILELVIGAWGAATVAIIPLSEWIVVRILGVDPSPVYHWAVVFIVVTASLLPATTAMGATLATAERFVTSRSQRQSTGLLYGANTAGATLGAIGAVFWLMPTFGIRGSLLIFALVNIFCGIAALLLVRGAPVIQTSCPADRRGSAILGIKLFGAGLLGIGLEVVIIRALSHVLENTVYTFAMVLAVYLAGTAAGALFAEKRAGARFMRPAWLFSALAVTSLCAGLTLAWSAGIYQMFRNFLGDSLAGVATAECLTTATYFLIPAILMGASLTVLAIESLDKKPSLAWAVGLNTAGAAVGPALVGLLVLPVVGLKGALSIFPVGYALLAARKEFVVPMFVVSVLSIPMLTSVRQLIDPEGQQIISIHEGVMGSVAVLEATNGARVLKFNNRFQMGGTAARSAEERQAVIPLLLHENPRHALFIGLGTGITFASANYFPTVISDGVELVPEIARVMPLFNDPGALQSSNLTIHLADGRRFVRATFTKYDVIISDLFHPAQDGAGFLYTREHFSAMRGQLAESGLFCQWLPVYQMDLPTIRIVMATFAEIFPHNEVWLLRFNLDVPVIGLIGRTVPANYSDETIENKIRANPQITEFLKRLGLGDSIRLFGGYVGPINVPSNTEINTDWNPVLIFNAPELTFRRRDDPAERLLTLIEALQKSPADILTDPSPQFFRKLDTFAQARNIYLKGLWFDAQGDAAKALSAYIESARISSDFTAGYAQALTIATALAHERPEQSREILMRLIDAQPEYPVAEELLRRLPR